MSHVEKRVRWPIAYTLTVALGSSEKGVLFLEGRAEKRREPDGVCADAAFVRV